MLHPMAPGKQYELLLTGCNTYLQYVINYKLQYQIWEEIESKIPSNYWYGIRAYGIICLIFVGIHTSRLAASSELRRVRASDKIAGMSHLIRKRHKVSILVYHIVCPAKYRRIVFSEEVDQVLKSVCLDIAQRYELVFLEIGTDRDHVHFLVQSVASYSPTRTVTIIKSLTARQIFARVPSVKKPLWGGEFWSDGYYIGTVGQHATETTIRHYVKNQGRESKYSQLHQQQLRLFD
jgi:putative transposase